MITTSSEDKIILKELNKLSDFFQGDVYTDDTNRILYATDASAYREIPLAVVRPKNSKDLKKIIRFANKHKISLIPRTAGTSLAGQVVGYGIVVDVSKYMTRILEINTEEKWVKVEPGVILDELNKILLQKGLFFGPETSTANRCMMGGMLGNNGCGLHSLTYGSTRDHTLETKALLSDGSEVLFKALNKEEFETKCIGDQLENKLYQQIRDLFSDDAIQEEIRVQFPDPAIERRNTGYALDLLLDSSPFSQTDKKFNFCELLAGSEGTLAFFTEIKLNLVEAPPINKSLVCVHLDSVLEATKANLIALKQKPSAIELMDRAILDLTKENHSAQKNRFFIKGDPGALLIVEFNEKNIETIEAKKDAMEQEMRAASLGYYFPEITGGDIKKVWDLRKAGLGVLSNLPGDSKPVSVIEDTAVKPEDLPAYIEEFDQIIAKYNLKCVYHAHIATGELHLRPILNLKDPHDVEMFHTIAEESAKLVKKYKGSLSGEHGDGRLRGEFIPLMMGNKIYSLFQDIKEQWDPDHIFNPGKITDTPAMNTQLRYDQNKETRTFETIFDFSKEMGILRAAEKCNGSSDCRKSEIIGGTMCPSYMATRNESSTTRARANILREFL
ncbi:MAG: FAD-binding oxidoreductase, partial [Bacteroidales bacterium]|nr:FAD-binding oxidoreductase [Bacteroidales bacterium]